MDDQVMDECIDPRQAINRDDQVNVMDECHSESKHDPQVSPNCILIEGGVYMAPLAPTDCVFKVGTEGQEKEFHCHKLTLAKVSEVFQTMFFGSMAEHNCVIRVPDVEPKDFSRVQEFAYNGPIIINSLEEATQLLYVACKYIITDLKLQCFKLICEKLDANNVFNIYDLAIQYDEHKLAGHCLQYIKEDAEELFKSPSFLEIQPLTLITILAQDHLNVSSELSVINACIQWAEREAQDQHLPLNRSGLRTALGPMALQLIRFLSLTPTQFTTGPAESELLSTKEGYCILRRMFSSKVKLPPGFSDSNIRRTFRKSLFLKNVFESCIKFCQLTADPFPQNLFVDYHHVDPYDVTGGDVSILHFTVSKDILLLGFQVFSRTKNTPWGSNISAKTYCESVSACIFVDERSQVTAIVEDSEVAYDSLVPVLFDKPVKLTKNIEQETIFRFFKQGHYNVIDYTQRLRGHCVEGIDFVLRQNESDGLIFAILFTVP